MGWSSLLPSGIRDWMERREALREIQEIADEQTLKLKSDDNNPVNLAKIALSLNDPEGALQHWRNALTRFPQFTKTNPDSLDIMIRLQLFDEADSIMRECMKHFPADSFYAAGYALVAQERKDIPEATKRWKYVLKHHPSWWKPYVHYAVMLCEGGEKEEADVILTKAISQFPDEPIPRIEWARNAERRGRTEEALARWQNVYDRFKHGTADIGIAKALDQLGRTEEAEAHLQEAKVRSPLVHELRMILAHLALKRGDTDEALRRWMEVRTRFPLLPFGYQGEGHLLRDLGRFDEAEAVIHEAKDRFPHETWPDNELRTTQKAREAAA